MKTLLGYHDKQKDRYGIIEKQVPMLIHERYEPFLITSNEFFTVRTHEVITMRHAHPIKKAVSKFKNTLATILLIPGIITAVLYILDFITALNKAEGFSTTIPSSITNLTFWVAVSGAMFLWHESYRTLHQKDHILQTSDFSEHDVKLIKQGDLGIGKRAAKNALDVLDHEAEDILLESIADNAINTKILFDKLLTYPSVQTVINRLNINDDVSTLKETAASSEHLLAYDIPATRSLVIYAAEEAALSTSPAISPEHLFIALFKVFPSLDLFLKERRLNLELMRYVASWIQMRNREMQTTQVLNPDIPYHRTGGIAQLWIYGYTFILSHFSKDLTQELAKKGGRWGIGHDAEMEEIISILTKLSKNNVLLIGESGTGKTSIAKGLAERINKRLVPPNILDMRVIQLDINGLVAAAPQHGNLENLVQQSMDELQKAGNTVLFIDEIQEIIGVHGEESKHSLAGILLPHILDSKFPIIATITYADYKKYFYSRESLRQSFQNVEIHEVSPQAAFEIILTRLVELESTYHLKITFPAILAAVELAQRYVYDRKLPDSAVNIIEAASAEQQKDNNPVLLPEHVAETVSRQTTIPVEDVTAEEATKLLELEETMKSKVIGQDEAVHQVVESLKRARTGIRDPRKPIGTFLFLGPTGVGKTYLSKILGSTYFGEAHKMIRLDMSEFKDVSSVSRLIGTSTISETAQTPVTFLDEVKNNPHAVILLDELEKAHPQILDLFLQVLDEGHMTNANGETINFKNCIIIATSNIGSKVLLESLEKDHAMFEEAKQRVLLELRHSVRVEFLNRFDQIIVFAPHSKENLAKIADLLLNELRSRLLEKEITLKWTENLPRVIAERAYQPGLGARPLRRYIQDHIESGIAGKLLRGEIKPGDVFTATEELMPSGV